MCLTGPDHVTNQTETVAIGKFQIIYKKEISAWCKAGALLLAGSNLSTQMWSAIRPGKKDYIYTRI